MSTNAGKLVGFYRVKSGMSVTHGGKTWLGGEKLEADHPAVATSMWKLLPDKADPPRLAAPPAPKPKAPPFTQHESPPQAHTKP